MVDFLKGVIKRLFEFLVLEFFFLAACFVVLVVSFVLLLFYYYFLIFRESCACVSVRPESISFIYHLKKLIILFSKEKNRAFFSVSDVVYYPFFLSIYFRFLFCFSGPLNNAFSLFLSRLKSCEMMI